MRERESGSVTECSLFYMQPSKRYLMELGHDVLVLLPYWSSLAYLICCMSPSDHPLFSYSSTKTIAGVSACPRKIRVLPNHTLSSGFTQLVQKIYTFFEEMRCKDISKLKLRQCAFFKQFEEKL